MYFEYLVLPTKYSFPKLVRIYTYIMSFIKKTRKDKDFAGPFLKGTNVRFSVFSTNVFTENSTSLVVCQSSEFTGQNKIQSLAAHFAFKGQIATNTVSEDHCLLIEDNIQLAFLYLFRKAAAEVKQFNSSVFVNKIAFEKDGILFSKGRILDGMNFVDTGELGNLNIGELGVKINTPVLDRYSPLSYSIAKHIHYTIGMHRGVETSNRISLEQVSIIQGMILYKEIADDCWKCKMKRKKFLEVSMGPIAQEQLMVAPPFHSAMLDLFGPVESYVPGFERNTRNRKVLQSQMYVMVSVCITTKIVNLQILEGKKAHNIIDGFTRLSAEVGVPSVMHVDQDSGIMAGFKDAEFDYRDLQLQLHRQYGIKFITCPKSGHHQHGLVERIIRSIQETFDEYGLKSKRLHSMGWQTFCKLAENAYNNVPFGYSHGREQDNTELLRMLTPNMLRVGRINSRALDGPIRLPVTRQELLGHVDKLYAGWFRIFKDTVVPRLINQPKWFKVEKDLREGDVVYFKKDDSVLGSVWTIGEVDQIVVGRDGHVRRAIIKYFAVNEKDPFKATLQFTDRASRSLVKLWSVDEIDIFDDLSELQRRLDSKVPDDQANCQVNAGTVVCGVIPIYMLSDGDEICLKQFSLSCTDKSLKRNKSLDCQTEIGDEMDLKMRMGSFNKLITSTGFMLD